ncbi:MAG: MFS transporter [Pseudomonadota bacterium]
MALTTGQKIGWGLADLGVVTFVIIKQLLVLAFLTTVLGVPVVLASYLTTCILLFDILTDPMVGAASDQTETRFGRRAPWMFWGSVVMAVGVVALFSVPEGLDELLIVGWVGFGFAIATIGFTMVTVPYSAMAGEMTESPQERTQLTAWRMTFACLGILAGGAVLPALANSVGYKTASLMIAPVLVAPIWISILLTRKAPSHFRPTQLDVGAMARTVFGNLPFVVLFVTYGLMTLAVATLMAGLPFAALYLFVDDGTSPLSDIATSLTIMSFTLAAFVIGALISQSFWAYLSRRISKLMATVIGLVLYIILLLALPQFVPITNMTFLGVLFLCFGFANGAYQQVPWAMYPDLIDITRRETGQRIEGAFSALWLLGQKVANAFGPLVLGAIIGLFGFQSSRGGPVEQSDEAIDALLMAMTYLPASIFGVSILVLIFVFRPMLRDAEQKSLYGAMT